MTTPNYSHLSHTHCFDQENPPCGLKGKHCCLCDIVTTPEGKQENDLDVKIGDIVGDSEKTLKLLSLFRSLLQSREKEVLEWVLNDTILSDMDTGAANHLRDQIQSRLASLNSK